MNTLLSNDLSFIVTQVHEDSYAAHQELQLHIKQCQINQRSQPLHQQLEHHSNLQKDLAHAEYILLRLGNIASLVDCMIVQSLVTIIHREVTSFLSIVLEVNINPHTFIPCRILQNLFGLCNPCCSLKKKNV